MEEFGQDEDKLDQKIAEHLKKVEQKRREKEKKERIRNRKLLK